MLAASTGSFTKCSPACAVKIFSCRSKLVCAQWHLLKQVVVLIDLWGTRGASSSVLTQGLLGNGTSASLCPLIASEGCSALLWAAEFTCRVYGSAGSAGAALLSCCLTAGTWWIWVSVRVQDVSGAWDWAVGCFICSLGWLTVSAARLLLLLLLLVLAWAGRWDCQGLPHGADWAIRQIVL